MQSLMKTTKVILAAICLFNASTAQTSPPTETVRMEAYFHSSYNFPDFYEGYVMSLNVTKETQVLEVVDTYSLNISNAKVAEIFFSNSETTFFIAQFFTTFPNLKKLQMTQGKLERIQENSFKNAGKLEILDLMNNALRFIGPNTFLGAERLTQLGLWSNKIEGIDANAFNGLPSLQKIAMSSNKLRTIPATLFSFLPNLDTILLSENELTSIPSKLFSRNPKLEMIAFGNNRINSISPNLLDNLKALKDFNINENVCVGKNYDGSWFTQIPTPEWLQLIQNALVPCFNNFVEAPEHCPAF